MLQALSGAVSDPSPVWLRHLGVSYTERKDLRTFKLPIGNPK